MNLAFERNGTESKDALDHYGYKSEAPACGFWPNDGNALDRLSVLPEALKLYNASKSKIRIVFDYDPDYPKALLQVWGLQQPDLLADSN